MNPLPSLLSLLFATSISSISLIAAESRDLILIAGQSNAVGYDAYPETLSEDPTDKNVMFWWRVGDPPPDDYDSTSARKWTTLQIQPRGNPISKTAPPADAPSEGLGRQYGNFKSPEGGFGPEMGLARELQRKQTKSLAIVKAAFSGTGLRKDWNVNDPGAGGACFRALVTEAKAAIAAAAEAGVTLHPRALVWVQGESDSNAQDAPKYEQALAEMLGALRKEIGAPDLRCLVGVNVHFGNDKNRYVAEVISAQKAVALSDKLCVYVETDGAETLLPSQTHFTGKGTLEVGRRFAEALLKAESSTAAP